MVLPRRRLKTSALDCRQPSFALIDTTDRTDAHHTRNVGSQRVDKTVVKLPIPNAPSEKPEVF